MVQANGIRLLDSRLSVERDSRAKYSTPARSRALGLACAMRAIPTSWTGFTPTQSADSITHLAWRGAPSFAFYSPFVNRAWRLGTGVICYRILFETPVIPAKAGIHFSSLWKRTEGKLDSRFRGNDCAFERPGLANDTSTWRLNDVSAARRSEFPPCQWKTRPSPIVSWERFSGQPVWRRGWSRRRIRLRPRCRWAARWRRPNRRR